MSPPRPRFFLSLVIGYCALGILPVAFAQRYILKDNTALAAAEVTLGSGALIQQVAIPGGGSFERRYPLADIARLDFPAPEALDEAEKLVAAGSGEDALKLIEPTYRQFALLQKSPAPTGRSPPNSASRPSCSTPTTARSAHPPAN